MLLSLFEFTIFIPDYTMRTVRVRVSLRNTSF